MLKSVVVLKIFKTYSSSLSLNSGVSKNSFDTVDMVVEEKRGMRVFAVILHASGFFKIPSSYGHPSKIYD